MSASCSSSPGGSGTSSGAVGSAQSKSKGCAMREVRGGEPDERNPLCDHPAYRTAMRRMLPNLQTLDGERTMLADVALPKDASDALKELTFAEPEPWLKDFDWGGDDTSESVGLGLGQLKSAQTFDTALTECKRMSAKAQSLIEDYKAKTPR